MTDDKAVPTPRLEALDRAAFRGLNAHDQLYRTAAGYTVKVRLALHSYTPGQLIYRLTGAWVDDTTGKAMPYGEDGRFLAGEHHCQAKADGKPEDPPADLDELLAIGTAAVVQQVERAILVHAQHQALLTAGHVRTPQPPAA